MQKRSESLSLIGSFILVYILIVGLLSGLITFGFHLYRGQMVRGELGLQAGIMTAEIGPLARAAIQRGDGDAARSLLRSFFVFPAVLCISLKEQDITQLSWPQTGCPAGEDAGIDYLVLPFDGGGAVMQIGIDGRYQKHQSWQVTKTFSFFVIAVITIIALIVSLLLSRIILRPLMRLQRAMNISTPDNLIWATDLRNDELAGTGEAYNRLADSARSYFQKMLETQTQLSESQARFRDMAEISTDWFYELDSSLSLSYLSEHFFLDYRKGSVAGDGPAGHSLARRKPG